MLCDQTSKGELHPGDGVILSLANLRDIPVMESSYRLPICARTPLMKVTEKALIACCILRYTQSFLPEKHAKSQLAYISTVRTNLAQKISICRSSTDCTAAIKKNPNQKASNLLSMRPLLLMSQRSRNCFHTGVNVLPLSGTRWRHGEGNRARGR